MTKLGDPVLDDEHERLQRQVVLLLHVPADGALGALDDLRAAARLHFAAEDVDLRQMRGGNARCHLDEHAAVLKSLDEVHAAFLGDAFDAAAKDRLVRRLARQLLDWLPEHVQEMDGAVARHRFHARTGGAPVRIARVAAAGAS